MVAQWLKRLSAMQETWVRSLGQEDPLEEEILDPLQYSCLENPMGGGAWWATVHGVTKSQTRLHFLIKNLSHSLKDQAQLLDYP